MAAFACNTKPLLNARWTSLNKRNHVFLLFFLMCLLQPRMMFKFKQQRLFLQEMNTECNLPLYAIGALLFSKIEKEKQSYSYSQEESIVLSLISNLVPRI